MRVRSLEIARPLGLDLHGAIDGYYVTYLKSQASKQRRLSTRAKPGRIRDAEVEKLCEKVAAAVNDKSRLQRTDTEEGICKKRGVMAQREWFAGSLQEWGYDCLNAVTSLTLEYSRRDAPKSQRQNMYRMLISALQNAPDPQGPQRRQCPKH